MDEKKNPVLACRPVDISTLPEMSVPIPAIYPGSIVGECLDCGQEIYVGPKQQEVDGIRLCFLCALAFMHRLNLGEEHLFSLGNPYQPEGEK